MSEECLSQQRAPHHPSFPFAIWTFLLCVWNESILNLSWVWAGSARVCFSVNGLFSSMWLQVPEGPQSGRAVWLAGGGLVLIADYWCWGGWLRKRERERKRERGRWRRSEIRRAAGEVCMSACSRVHKQQSILGFQRREVEEMMPKPRTSNKGFNIFTWDPNPPLSCGPFLSFRVGSSNHSSLLATPSSAACSPDIKWEL